MLIWFNVFNKVLRCFLKRLAAAMFLIILLPYICMSAPVIYQAEDGTMSGTYKSATLAGYQGTGYVDGWDTAGDYCAVTVNVPSAGMYTITIGYAATMGQKINDLYVNGVFQANVTFPSSAGFTSLSAGMVPLNAGNNEIRIVQNWGWFYLDWIGVDTAVLPALNVSKNLVNSNSSAATKCLFSSLVDSYGNSIVSGQCGAADTTWINTATAHYPAIQGFDMMDYSPSRVAYGAADPMQVEQAIAWYQAGGIVQFQWHWNAPMDLINTTGHEWWRGFYTDSTTFDVQYAMNNPGSTEYNALVSDIDAIAVQLKRLRDAGVPVLWRPLHEAQGGWFWWGAKGYAPCVALYHLMYDRLTNYHGLNNLIWVWTTQDNAAAADWYPGGAYADIVGADIYLSGQNYSPSTGMFYNIVNLFGGNKMVALTETGTIPDMAQAKAQKAYWAYFMTWNGFENDTSQNTLGHVQAVYNDSLVIKREDLANIYNCGTATFTASATPTFTGTFTRTFTGTFTPTVTRTYTATPTNTMPSPSYTPTRTITVNTPAFTATATVNTPAYTATAAQSGTFTRTLTPTQTQTPALSGTIYFSTDRDGNEEIYGMDLAAGISADVTNNTANDYNPNISPDGQWMVFTSDRSGTYQIYKMKLSDSSVTRLTNDGATDWDPAFSPDGTRIVFKSNRDDGYGDIFIMNSDGTGQSNLTPSMNSSEEWDPDFSRDGSKIVFVSRGTPSDPNTDEIYVMNSDGSGRVRLTNNSYPDWYPSCSPVSDTILFISKTAAGQPDNIFTMDFNGANKSKLGSLAGDNDDPYYTPDGTGIIFCNNNAGNYDLYYMKSDGSGQAPAAVNPYNDICPVYLRNNAVTPTLTATDTNTPQADPTLTSSATQAAITPSYTCTPAPSCTVTATPTATPAALTATATWTAQPAYTATLINTPTLTRTAAASATSTRTVTASATLTRTTTPQGSATITPTCTLAVYGAAPDELTMFPNPYNPAKGDLQFLVRPAAAADIEVKIYTKAYRLILVKSVKIPGAIEEVISVNASEMKGLSPGLYYITVRYIYDSGSESHGIGMFFVVK